MANILSVFESDGTTPLQIQYRGGIPQPLFRVRLTYSEDGGTGFSEYVIRNTSATSRAIRVKVSTTQKPTDPDGGGQLLQEWAQQDPKTEIWSVYAETVEIPEISPGSVVRVRVQVTATATTEPTTHRAGVAFHYLRSSVS